MLFASALLPADDSGRGQHGGNIRLMIYMETLDLNSIGANDAVNSDETVTGLAVGDIPIFFQVAEGLATGVIFTTLGPVALADTLRVRGENTTAAPIDPAGAVCFVGVLRTGSH